MRQARLCGSSGLAVAVFLLLPILLPAQEPKPLPGSTECVNCHDSGKSTGKREAGMPPNFDAAALRSSPHAEQECASCHADLASVKEFPHPEKLKPVDCSSCHPDVADEFKNSLHGRVPGAMAKLAPNCKTCHGWHNIRRPSEQGSPTSTFQIPALCGQCHKEGTPVSEARLIPKTDILNNYTDSIHGQALVKMGLTVTAVCTSCHTAHSVLPHTDPKSSIAKDNIVKTCTKCHTQIETVHQKIIRGELWEKQPHSIPACVDCHDPHNIRPPDYYAQGMADADCQRCHGNPTLSATRGGKTVSLYVNRDELQHSRHAKIACAQCHTGTTPSSSDRPCKTVVPKVNCSNCHEQQGTDYAQSTHGQLAAKGSPDAPGCSDCHGSHGVLGRTDIASVTYPRNVPNLCATCHRAGQKAALRYTGKQRDIVENYTESIHGRGLIQAGLTVTANCADCHTAHMELPASDSRSSVNRSNVAKTCAKCHRGIYEQFVQSVHSPTSHPSSKPLPECSDCHTAHSIERTDQADFRLNIMNQCGKCHEAITASYFETYHGKVSKLGGLKTAKCYDCHGAHDVLPVTDPRSHLSRANIVKTCAQCHTNAHRQFAGYLTHATHHDPVRYPMLFWTFWGMTSLLLGTFIISGAHTALWLPRSLQYRRKLIKEHALEGAVYVRRFRTYERNLHLMIVTSFLGLASTGMILKFSYAPWAAWGARLLGGFEVAGWIHRLCALLTFTYFGAHLFDLRRKKLASGLSWFKFLTGPESMLLNRRDWREFVASLKWFLGKGQRPQYGRWTYWEKFDYFAVFWGVAIIGGTGLLLWWPEFFTHLLPGWAINVATTIHSDEALLAVGFIFTVHFFNTHFRPEKFPIDTVIFTGGVPLEEFKQDRPREYEEMVAKGELEANLMPAPVPLAAKLWRRLGFTALGIGLTLIALIVYAVLFAYR